MSALEKSTEFFGTFMAFCVDTINGLKEVNCLTLVVMLFASGFVGDRLSF